MRSEQEMMDLIATFAKNDDCVRVVTMEGSRLNKNAPKDRFQDFDVNFIVTDMEKYKNNDNWLDVFGERVIMQKPEAMVMFPPTLGNWFRYLMQYGDGNRMDLTLIPFNEAEKYFDGADSLTKIILDKDAICPRLDEASDRDYHVKRPSFEFINDCCNEFWWLSTYVAKGLCRGELLYAINHLNMMREQMLIMVSWKAGVETSFAASVGKAYKYLDKYISKELWEAIIETYKNGSIDEVWDSLTLCCDLFQETTNYVSKELHYKCPDYNKNVIRYIRQFFPLHKIEKIKIL
ncbi:MAG: aminoglycoside 6-adenylyltransferase [Treponema sp.]|jgi:aminoglycoside 6-adenylyltransferase|nr:aminoglycoside 6-adenylyltransferase [Treponema sp.]